LSGQLQKVQVMALTGQMHTAVLLDAHGAVVSPAILWLDRRAMAETAEPKARLGLPPYQLNSRIPCLSYTAWHATSPACSVVSPTSCGSRITCATVLRANTSRTTPKQGLRRCSTGTP
jgi:hypothetical protein